MDKKIVIACIIIMIATIMVSFTIVIMYHKAVRKILENMAVMIKDAKNGSFCEKNYNESMLSYVESNLAEYITITEISKNKISDERDKIKELISDISHQTKTPISNILLFSQILAEHELDKDNREYVKSIVEQSNKLDFLIRSLIKTSRLETGIISLQPKSNKCMPMLEVVYKQILPKAENKKITLKLNSTDVTAIFDVKWTTEAVYNIVDNAVKYTPKGGMIEIEVIKYELFVAIKIKDNGIGIKESEIAQIFGRFYRSADVRDKEGVGLGLYLARQIVSSENGYIKVKSKPKKGSIFYIYLRGL